MSGKLWFNNIVNSRVAIGLCPNSPMRYQNNIVNKNISNFIKLTPYILFGDNSKILATTKRGQFHMFKHLEAFEIEIYYAIILSLVVISGVMSVHKKSIKVFFETFWSYFSVILHGSCDIDTKASLVMPNLWLLSCTILLAAFSGKLLTFLMIPQPVYWINSWDDLFEWKHLKIQTITQTDLGYFITNNPNNSVTQALSSRSFLYPLSILSDPLLKMLDLKGVSDGNVAIVFPSQYLHVFKRYLMKRDMIEDMDFHISEFGDPWKPYFIWYNTRNLNKFYQDKLNKL